MSLSRPRGWLARWFRSTLRFVAPRTPYPAGRPSSRLTYRPQLESLEERCLLSNFLVTNLGDSNAPGSGSLRDAINQANAAGGTNTILFTGAGASGTILLNGGFFGLPVIQNNLTIQGPGAGTLTVQRPAANPQTFGIFVINTGFTAAISGLTITGGDNTMADGGAIENLGTLTLTNSVITGNSVTSSTTYGYGGGVDNQGTLTVDGCAFSNNSASSTFKAGPIGAGGAIGCRYQAGQNPQFRITNSTFSNNTATFGGAVQIFGTAQIGNCSFAGNQATGGGGAIDNLGNMTLTNSVITGNSVAASAFVAQGGGVENVGTLAVDGCTFANNSASSTYAARPFGYGGAISNVYNSAHDHAVTITNSTFANNSAVTGGAIDSYGVAMISGSTFYGNRATTNGGALENRIGAAMTLVNNTIVNNTAQNQGGGIRTLDTLTVVNCTITGNTAVTGDGGGISRRTGYHAPVLENTIVAGNAAPLGPDISAAAITANYCFIGNPAGATITGGNNLNGDPMLGPLQNNGGPTLTRAPLPGSPVIDAGSNSFVTPALFGTPPHDQTGRNRILNGFVDIGAVEFQPPPRQAPILVVGADAGHLPEVKVYDASTGALKFDFLAYNAQFLGGVRVASADVNGDGFPDIITAPGPGGGPLVEVFSGRDLSLLLAFNAYDPAFANGLFVAAGDVNRDGFADVITAPDQGGGPLVEVFSGRDGALLRSFNAYDPTFLGGVRVAAGDTNGDGFADVITGPGVGGGPLVEIFDGKTGAVLQSYNAYAGAFVGGIFVAAGDVDGDGKADVIVSPGLGGGPLVQVFSGATGALLRAFNAYPPTGTLIGVIDGGVWQSGARVAVLDVNGDGKAEIMTGAGPGQRSEVILFDAVTLAVVDDFFAFDPDFLGGVFVGAGR